MRTVRRLLKYSLTFTLVLFLFFDSYAAKLIDIKRDLLTSDEINNYLIKLNNKSSNFKYVDPNYQKVYSDLSNKQSDMADSAKCEYSPGISDAYYQKVYKQYPNLLYKLVKFKNFGITKKHFQGTPGSYFISQIMLKFPTTDETDKYFDGYLSSFYDCNKGKDIKSDKDNSDYYDQKNQILRIARYRDSYSYIYFMVAKGSDYIYEMVATRAHGDSEKSGEFVKYFRQDVNNFTLLLEKQREKYKNNN